MCPLEHCQPCLFSLCVSKESKLCPGAQTPMMMTGSTVTKVGFPSRNCFYHANIDSDHADALCYIYIQYSFLTMYLAYSKHGV